ncbi:hypothetical protein [Sulfitobacter sp. 1A15106]|uniref:hypothetical protein n=1 Tax=Sulfitobacter sp. 1A15106 TaxID=3368590 RepID=UPI0037450F02
MTKVDPKNDLLVIQDTSVGDFGSISPYEILNAVLVPPSGTTLTMDKNPATGRITLNLSTGAFLTSSTAVLAGPGLIGGGDLSQDRVLKLDVSTLLPVASVDPVNDYIPIHDASAGGTRRVSIAEVNASIDTSASTARPMGTI